LLCQLLLVGSK